MKNKWVRIVVGMTALVLLASCSDKEEKKIGPAEKTVVVTAWGKDFVIKPMAEGSALEKKWAKAVVQVRTIENANGSGFFISPDGLFMTNEHVISKSRCTQERCPGLKVVRDFSRDGDMEVFTNVRPVIQDTELDFAIFKVELPPGHTVPFLELSTDAEKFPPDRKLTVVGHPAGGPAKVTPILMNWASSKFIQYKGPTFWGNSGSPIIDPATGAVVGIVQSIAFTADSILDNGEVEILNYGVNIQGAVDWTKKAYPKFSVEPEYVAVLSDPVNRSADDSITPFSAAHFNELKVLDFDEFLTSYLGSDTASEDALERFWAGEVVKNNQGPVESLWDLNEIERLSGKPLKIEGEAARLITESIGIDAEGNAGWDAWLKMRFGSMNRSDCLASDGVDQKITFAMAYCGSTVNSHGQTLMEELAEGIRYYKSINDRDQLEIYRTRVQRLVYSRLTLGSITEPERRAMIEALDERISSTNRLASKFAAESLRLIVERNLSLVGPGTFN